MWNAKPVSALPLAWDIVDEIKDWWERVALAEFTDQVLEAKFISQETFHATPKWGRGTEKEYINSNMSEMIR